jgi:hypothetical protein
MEVLEMENAYVYWIKKATHTDVNKEGYIGVARDIKNRIYRHKLQASKGQHQNNLLQEILFDDDTIVEVIFYGKEEDCYLKELELRPSFRICWNIVPGGQGGSTTLGMKYSDEFCNHRSELMKGNQIAKGNHKPKSEEHKKKISLGITGRIPTEEHRMKQSLAMKGRKQSTESNEKRRLANLGKKRGPYKKKNEQLVI